MTSESDRDNRNTDEGDKTSQHKELSERELGKLERMAADMPGLMEYAHNLGGVPIEPTQEGVIKGKAMQAMQEQSTGQMSMLADFMNLAMHHAQKIQERTKIALDIYNTRIKFQPQIGKEYWLYENQTGQRALSLVSPDEWGSDHTPLGLCLARVRLMADHTWELVESFRDFQHSP